MSLRFVRKPTYRTTNCHPGLCERARIVSHTRKALALPWWACAPCRAIPYFKNVSTRSMGMPKLKLSLPSLPAKLTATSLPSSSTTGEPLDPCLAGML